MFGQNPLEVEKAFANQHLNTSEFNWYQGRLMHMKYSALPRPLFLNFKHPCNTGVVYWFDTRSSRCLLLLSLFYYLLKLPNLDPKYQFAYKYSKIRRAGFFTFFFFLYLLSIHRTLNYASSTKTMSFTKRKKSRMQKILSRLLLQHLREFKHFCITSNFNICCYRSEGGTAVKEKIKLKRLQTSSNLSLPRTRHRVLQAELSVYSF